MGLHKGQHNSGIKNLVSFPKGKSGYHFNPREVQCKCCGTIFTTIGTRTLYCSLRCKEKSRPDKQKTRFVCQFCGKPFLRRAPNNMGRFCSRQCSGLWFIANGKKNYFYKAFLYKKHKCNKCGNDDFTVLLVHHRDKNRKHNALRNLEILCANCHYRLHFGNGSTRHRKIKPIINYLKRIDKHESNIKR